MSPYRASLHWWEAVLLLHRLTLAFLYTFGSSIPAEQSMLAVLVCVGFLLLHVLARPFLHAKTQRVQTVLLLSLSVLALTRVFSSSLLQLGASPGASSEDSIAGTNTFCSVLNGAFQYAVPAAIVLLPAGVSLAKVAHWLRLKGKKDTAKVSSESELVFQAPDEPEGFELESKRLRWHDLHHHGE